MSFVSFETNNKVTYGVWIDEDNWIQAPESFQLDYPDLRSVIAADKLEQLEGLTRSN